jgi:hypothetical protein
MSILTSWAVLATVGIFAGALVAYTSSHTSPLKGVAYVLTNSTTHVRYLPLEARHTFTYPTLSFLLSLKDLENNRLDLGRRWVFAFNPTTWTLTALSQQSYLQDGSRFAHLTLSSKLDVLLRERQLHSIADAIGESWVMTMPGYLGFRGINPLTVYFSYDKISSNLILVVLEVCTIFYVSKIGNSQLLLARFTTHSASDTCTFLSPIMMKILKSLQSMCS